MEVNIDEHIPKDDYFLYSIFDHASQVDFGENGTSLKEKFF